MATNEPLDVYGGFRAPDSILEGLAASLRDGQLPFTFNHDALRAVRTANFDAGVETMADGSKQVWAEFDIDEDDWAETEAEFKRHGVRGGVSWSMTANPQQVGVQGESPPGLLIAVDAGFFDVDELVENAAALAAVAPLEVREIYQFGALPPALVVIEIQQQSELWKDLVVGGTASLAAAMLYDLLKRLLKPLHRHQPTEVEPKTSFDFKLEEGGRVTQLHLRTDDAEVLKTALDRLPLAVAQDQPTLAFDPERNDWVPPN